MDYITLFRATPETRSTTDKIVLHHTAGMGSIQANHQSHLNNGWHGIGYNYQVNIDGSIWQGRPVDAVGAHTLGHNTTSVGIAAQGNFHTQLQRMSDAQFNSIMWLIHYIRFTYGMDLPIYGHRDLGATACPGVFFPLAEFRGGRFRGNITVTFRYAPVLPWYYLHMHEATNSNRFERLPDGSKRWLELLPPPNHR